MKIKLNEVQLRNIIKESIKNVIKENYGSLGTYYEQLKSYILSRKDCIHQHNTNGVDTYNVNANMVLDNKKCSSVYLAVDNNRKQEYIGVQGYGIIQNDQVAAMVLYNLKNNNY